VGQIGPWDNSKEWESQGLSRDSSPLNGTWDSPMGNMTRDGKLGEEERGVEGRRRDEAR